MSLFTNLFSLKAPNKPTVKNRVVLLIGAQSFNLGIIGEAFCQALLYIIYGSRLQRGSIRLDIAPSSILNYAVGWND
jgi:hypothetical protein